MSKNIFSSQKTVTSSGTPVQLNAQTVDTDQVVIVKAMMTNLGIVSVGFDSTSAAKGSTTHVKLRAGESIALQVQDASKIWIDSTVSGEGVEVFVGSPLNSIPASFSQTFDLTATSPSSATTVAQTPVTGLGAFQSLLIFATLTGATGGVLDVYIQISPDGGITWVDYIHFAQLAAGAGAVSKVLTVAKQAQQTTITAVGTGTTPALAANTVVGGNWGDRMRVLFVAGASTIAGASQAIKIFATA